MRVIFFIIIGIFLFFTAPIWVPIVGVLGLVGAGTVVVGEGCVEINDCQAGIDQVDVANF